MAKKEAKKEAKEEVKEEMKEEIDVVEKPVRRRKKYKASIFITPDTGGCIRVKVAGKGGPYLLEAQTVPQSNVPSEWVKACIVTRMGANIRIHESKYMGFRLMNRTGTNMVSDEVYIAEELKK